MCIRDSFTFFGAYFLFKVTNFIIPLRVSEENEHIGLDLSQHDETLDPKLKPITEAHYG